MSQVNPLNPLQDFTNDALAVPDKLPKFKGGNYLLVYPVAFSQKLKKSGLYMAESSQDAFNSLQTIGKVVSTGPLAYKRDAFWDPETEKYLPMCEEGDFVVFSRLVTSSKTIFMNQAFWVIPDSAVLYVIDNPEDVYNGKYSVEYGKTDNE